MSGACLGVSSALVAMPLGAADVVFALGQLQACCVQLPPVLVLDVYVQQLRCFCLLFPLLHVSSLLLLRQFVLLLPLHAFFLLLLLRDVLPLLQRVSSLPLPQLSFLLLLLPQHVFFLLLLLPSSLPLPLHVSSLCFHVLVGFVQVLLLVLQGVSVVLPASSFS